MSWGARGGSGPARALLIGALIVGVPMPLLALALLAALFGSAVAGGSACIGQSAVALPRADGVLVGATVYEAEGAGAYGAGLAGHLSFAELGLESAVDSDRAHADRLGLALGLGGPLAPFSRLVIRAPNGYSVIAEKRDIGAGGAPIDGHPRAIDLWRSVRQALHLPPDWSGLVRVAAPPGEVLEVEAQSSSATVLAPEPQIALRSASARLDRAQRTEGTARQAQARLLSACADSRSSGSALAARIVRIARSQLAVRESPPGSECNPYGPCEPWCSLFASWVWRQAGVPVPALAFSGALYEWAAAHTRVAPPTRTPQPGWAVFFGSGPATPQSSLHVAIVEAVAPDGEMTLINGNYSGAVARSGPCLPAKAGAPAPVGCAEPGPIYGYGAPSS
jgi:hypothetical protein